MIHDNIIACPVCKGKLFFDEKRQEWICRVDKLAFPIHLNQVPILLIQEARLLSEGELKS